jgi:hypothetical protein
MTEDVPIQGQGSSHFLEMTSDIFEAKESSAVESPRREASSPWIPLNGAEIHVTTLWHFWRAPPRLLADPYQTGHGLPLESPASNSPKIVGTRPPRVVRRSPPLLLS